MTNEFIFLIKTEKEKATHWESWSWKTFAGLFWSEKLNLVIAASREFSLYDDKTF